MIVDCFTFFDELDLLELRLQTLDPVVDRFVLCEAPFTFRGEPKPLHFAQNSERFARWRAKIVPIVFPREADPDPWMNEWNQRDYLWAGLDDCAADDLVLLGDCDEIPDPALAAMRPKAKRILGHRQRFSIGYVNRVSSVPWIGTRALKFCDIQVYGSMSNVRKQLHDQLEFVEGGWHFSSFGGPEVMQRKLKSYSHTEYGIPYYSDLERLAVEYASENEARWIALDDSFPAPIRDGSRWSRYVWPKPVQVEDALVVPLEHAHGCLAYVPADALAVFVTAPEERPWTLAGRQRFGDAFKGVVRGLAEVLPQLDGSSWIVIDGLERQPLVALRELCARGSGIVAFARNARSLKQFESVLAGVPFEAGRAQGVAELRSWLDANGWKPEIFDRVESVDASGFIWSKAPEEFAQIGLREFEFRGIRRDRLADFLAHAFVLRFAPARAQ